MLEDYWLPRREGGRGTEITTLPGGENLRSIGRCGIFPEENVQSNARSCISIRG